MTNKVHRYIFFIQRNIISVFSDEFEPVTNCGEIEFELKDNFWNWWKDAVDYLSDDIIDFCFIYDKEYDILEDDFLKNYKSFWNIEDIKKFFERKNNLSNINVIDANNNELILNKSRFIDDNQEIVFYTNINFEAVKEINENKYKIFSKHDNIDCDNIELSPIAKYYVKTLEKEKMQK